MSQIVILPWTRPPQSLNDRSQHYVKAKATKQALEEARWAIRLANVEKRERIRLTINLRLKDRRRRDADNLAQTLKVCQDALVQEGVIPDDDWTHVPGSGQNIWPPVPGKGALMWLELEDVDPIFKG